MQPFVNFGKRVRLRPRIKNSSNRKFKQSNKPGNLGKKFNLFRILSNLDMHMAHIPFYRHKGQKKS